MKEREKEKIALKEIEKEDREEARDGRDGVNFVTTSAKLRIS